MSLINNLSTIPVSSLVNLSLLWKIAQAGKKNVFLTHEQIAERAKNIWIERGCPSNQDEQNWLEAENQLKQELGIL